MLAIGDASYLKVFTRSVSSARFSTYLAAAGTDETPAHALYFWNLRLAGELIFALQTCEVCARNRLNHHLSALFGSDWPHSQKALRQLTAEDRRRLLLQIAKSQTANRGHPPSPDRLVADLSLDFWVSLLTRSYSVPLQWHGPGMAAVFPHDPELTRDEAYRACNGARVLRNRVAHHEPLFRMPVDRIRADIDRILAAMSPASVASANAGCRVAATLLQRPQ